MEDNHVNTIMDADGISNEIFRQINSELLKGNQWIAYNSASYFLDSHDVYFFNNKDEASDFAESNISEYDNYRVIRASSVDDVLKQIPDGEKRFQLFAEGVINEQKESQQIIVSDNNALYNQLEELGFGNKLNTAISFYEKYPQERFQLPVKERSEKEVIEYWLYFEQNGKSGNYHLTTYEATLRIFPEVPNISLREFM